MQEKLPKAHKAIVPETKIKGYLLSPIHPNGRHKAAFFRSFGFSAESWWLLSAALLQHAVEHPLCDVQDTPFGRRYIVEGRMPAPDGRAPFVRSVWFIEAGDDVPRFVTAYPVEERKA